MYECNDEAVSHAEIDALSLIRASFSLIMALGSCTVNAKSLIFKFNYALFSKLFASIFFLKTIYNRVVSGCVLFKYN